MPMHQARPKSVCPGMSCSGCSSPECMAEGGKVGSGKQRYDFEKGVHSAREEDYNPKYGKWQRQSEAGSTVRDMTNPRYADAEDLRENAKLKQKAIDIHHKTLGQLHSMKKPHGNFAAGGRVSTYDATGVHEPASKYSSGDKDDAGISVSGANLRSGDPDRMRSAKHAHRQNLQVLKEKPKPNLYAEGGEVMDTPEHPDAHEDQELIDDELGGMMGDELIAAFDSKDKKRIMEGIEAIVLSVLNKGE